MTIRIKQYASCSTFHVGDDGVTVNVDCVPNPHLTLNMIQGIMPLSHYNRFFEVEILQDSKDNFFMIGTNSKESSPGSDPSWNLHLSLRYHSGDGGIFTAGEGLKSDNTYGRKGDRITVYMEESFPSRSLLNFFLNGRLVFRQWVAVPQRFLFPAVGVSNGPAAFRITWPHSGATSCVNMLTLNSSLSNWIGFRNIIRNDVRRTLTLVDYDDKERTGFNVQAPRPMDRESCYFEIELLTKLDPECCPSLGLSSAFTSKFKAPKLSPGKTDDSVKVWYPATRTFALPDRTIFDIWRPVYDNFRFSESIHFPVVESSVKGGRQAFVDVDNITQADTQTNSIQCICSYENQCFFKITVLEIDAECQIQIGAALNDFPIDGIDLRHRKQRAFFVSRNTENTYPVKEGDSVCCCIKKADQGETEVYFLVNNSIGQRIVLKHNLLDTYYPIVCFTPGSAQIRITWPYHVNSKTAQAVSEEEMMLTLKGGVEEFEDVMLIRETQTKEDDDATTRITPDEENGVVDANDEDEEHDNEDNVFTPVSDRASLSGPFPGPASYNEPHTSSDRGGKKKKHGSRGRVSKSGACAIL
ncbi:SPRY3-like protein [Mya arenaria]|uniref:SPRY3-like protein n=1 Tax=Mya arenaria TaxID=6604 RepID=A0ABY7FB76_MYAAR|nr:SPRY3-like protein [Mya arenaria]